MKPWRKWFSPQQSACFWVECRGIRWKQTALVNFADTSSYTLLLLLCMVQCVFFFNLIYRCKCRVSSCFWICNHQQYCSLCHTIAGLVWQDVERLFAAKLIFTGLVSVLFVKANGLQCKAGSASDLERKTPIRSTWLSADELAALILIQCLAVSFPLLLSLPLRRL